MEDWRLSTLNRALPQGAKMAKLQRNSMASDEPIQSEGAQLQAFLAELEENEHGIKEIAGWQTGFADLSRALDGIRPGLYLLLGAPAIGKTSFAKQLLDQSGDTQSHTRNLFHLR